MRISDWSSDVCSSDLLEEDPADGADGLVEASALCRFEIDEETHGPRAEMTLEEAPIGPGFSPETTGGQASHYFAQNRNVVLGLVLVLRPFNAQKVEIAPDQGERPLVQEPRDRKSVRAG